MTSMFTRRNFLAQSASLAAGFVLSRLRAAAKRPNDYIVVEGHRDIWELNDRFKLRDKSQHSPMRDFLVPRLIEGGLSVVIMPAGGDSVEERGGTTNLLEGSLRVLDMLLVEIEKTNGKASLIKTQADLPTRPNQGKVQIFLDLEGGGSIQIDPEPSYHPERRLALLRHFFRLGVRGMQLTHNGRNMLGEGIEGGKMGGRLSRFGVEVVQEMNRLGMLIGVSHLSANGVLHTAEITKHPIVSTHQNINPFLKTPLELIPEEVKAIASTGGVVGIRYIEGETAYKLLVDEVEHLAKTVGVRHIGVGWLGHDKGHPATGYVPGFSRGRQFSGVEAQSMYEHWETFIQMLEQRGFKNEEIGMIVGGNFLRVMREVLPS
ncbi:MAG: membrane dipeptidase [Acidobacteria bacterium]|nr:membrane dipeptidase [Acidobacteriota bacterium]